MSDGTMLLTLPTELIAAVLSFTDLPTVSAAVQTCSAVYAAWKGYENHLCRLICIRTGLADAQTCGAAAALHQDPRWADKGLSGELDPAELRVVVNSQGWMDRHDEITNWKEYARFRHAIHRNWLAGRANPRLLRPELPVGVDRFWRFKLDSAPGYVVVSGVEGRFFAFKRDGRLVWSTRAPMSHYPHVELSEGYIPVNLFGDLYIMFRRDDVTPREPVPAPVSQIAARMPLAWTTAGECGYQVDGTGEFPHCRATKLRYPFFVAAEPHADAIYIYDVRNRGITTLRFPDFPSDDEDALDEGFVGYVEVGDGLLFIAGLRSITICRLPEDMSRPGEHTLSTSACVVWPPDPPTEHVELADLLPESHYRGGFGQWSAVHHDGRGRHLVATSKLGDSWRGRVLWTTNFERVLFSGDQDLVEQKTVVLVSEGTEVVQLAVENGRAVFITTQTGGGSALWLLNLREFDDIADFAQNPPTPICLAWPLPSEFEPCRVEMTSNEIYVPIIADFLPSDPSADLTPLQDAFQRCRESLPSGKMPVHWKWQKLDGQTIVDYGADAAVHAEDLTDDDDTAAEVPEGASGGTIAQRMRQAWAEVVRLSFSPQGRHGADAFWVFSFDDTTA